MIAGRGEQGSIRGRPRRGAARGTCDHGRAGEEMDAERERRVGLNGAAFREVDERIEEVAESLWLDQLLDLVCECGNPECVQQITMTRSEYELLRSEPTRFAVFPGHEITDVEIVEQRKAYNVIRKREGAAADVARETDPRR